MGRARELANGGINDAILMDASAAGTDVNDNILLNGTDSDSADAGFNLLYENGTHDASVALTPSSFTLDSLNVSGTSTLRDTITLEGEIASGISFPATQLASTNANTLDDYEEGTYTPVVTINASSTGIALSNALGFYNKIGRQCNITNRITLTNKGSSTGIFAVSVPFTASSNSMQGGALLYYGANFSTLSANAVYAVAVADAATYNLATSAGGQLIGSGGGQADQIANNTDFIVTFTYLTT